MAIKKTADKGFPGVSPRVEGRMIMGERYGRISGEKKEQRENKWAIHTQKLARKEKRTYFLFRNMLTNIIIIP